jgi:hypothetical protein
MTLMLAGFGARYIRPGAINADDRLDAEGLE